MKRVRVVGVSKWSPVAEEGRGFDCGVHQWHFVRLRVSDVEWFKKGLPKLRSRHREGPTPLLEGIVSVDSTSSYTPKEEEEGLDDLVLEVFLPTP